MTLYLGKEAPKRYDEIPPKYLCLAYFCIGLSVMMIYAIGSTGLLAFSDFFAENKFDLAENCYYVRQIIFISGFLGCIFVLLIGLVGRYSCMSFHWILSFSYLAGSLYIAMYRTCLRSYTLLILRYIAFLSFFSHALQTATVYSIFDCKLPGGLRYLSLRLLSFFAGTRMSGPLLSFALLRRTDIWRAPSEAHPYLFDFGLVMIFGCVGVIVMLSAAFSSYLFFQNPFLARVDKLRWFILIYDRRGVARKRLFSGSVRKGWRTLLYVAFDPILITFSTFSSIDPLLGYKILFIQNFIYGLLVVLSVTVLQFSDDLMFDAKIQKGLFLESLEHAPDISNFTLLKTEDLNENSAKKVTYDPQSMELVPISSNNGGIKKLGIAPQPEPPWYLLNDTPWVYWGKNDCEYLSAFSMLMSIYNSMANVMCLIDTDDKTGMEAAYQKYVASVRSFTEKETASQPVSEEYELFLTVMCIMAHHKQVLLLKLGEYTDSYKIQLCDMIDFGYCNGSPLRILSKVLGKCCLSVSFGEKKVCIGDCDCCTPEYSKKLEEFFRSSVSETAERSADLMRKICDSLGTSKPGDSSAAQDTTAIRGSFYELLNFTKLTILLLSVFRRLEELILASKWLCILVDKLKKVSSSLEGRCPHVSGGDEGTTVSHERCPFSLLKHDIGPMLLDRLVEFHDKRRSALSRFSAKKLILTQVDGSSKCDIDINPESDSLNILRATIIVVVGIELLLGFIPDEKRHVSSGCEHQCLGSEENKNMYAFVLSCLVKCSDILYGMSKICDGYAGDVLKSSIAWFSSLYEVRSNECSPSGGYCLYPKAYIMGGDCIFKDDSEAGKSSFDSKLALDSISGMRSEISDARDTLADVKKRCDDFAEYINKMFPDGKCCMCKYMNCEVEEKKEEKKEDCKSACCISGANQLVDSFGKFLGQECDPDFKECNCVTCLASLAYSTSISASLIAQSSNFTDILRQDCNETCSQTYRFIKLMRTLIKCAKKCKSTCENCDLPALLRYCFGCTKCAKECAKKLNCSCKCSKEGNYMCYCLSSVLWSVHDELTDCNDRSYLCPCVDLLDFLVSVLRYLVCASPCSCNCTNSYKEFSRCRRMEHWRAYLRCYVFQGSNCKSAMIGECSKEKEECFCEECSKEDECCCEEKPCKCVNCEFCRLRLSIFFCDKCLKENKISVPKRPMITYSECKCTKCSNLLKCSQKDKDGKCSKENCKCCEDCKCCKEGCNNDECCKNGECCCKNDECCKEKGEKCCGDNCSCGTNLEFSSGVLDYSGCGHRLGCSVDILNEDFKTLKTNMCALSCMSTRLCNRVEALNECLDKDSNLLHGVEQLLCFIKSTLEERLCQMCEMNYKVDSKSMLYYSALGHVRCGIYKTVSDLYSAISEISSVLNRIVDSLISVINNVIYSVKVNFSLESENSEQLYIGDRIRKIAKDVESNRKSLLVARGKEHPLKSGTLIKPADKKIYDGSTTFLLPVGLPDSSGNTPFDRYKFLYFLERIWHFGWIAFVCVFIAWKTRNFGGGGLRHVVAGLGLVSVVHLCLSVRSMRLEFLEGGGNSSYGTAVNVVLTVGLLISSLFSCLSHIFWVYKDVVQSMDVLSHRLKSTGLGVSSPGRDRFLIIKRVFLTLWADILRLLAVFTPYDPDIENRPTNLRDRLKPFSERGNGEMQRFNRKSLDYTYDLGVLETKLLKYNTKDLKMLLDFASFASLVLDDIGILNNTSPYFASLCSDLNLFWSAWHASSRISDEILHCYFTRNAILYEFSISPMLQSRPTSPALPLSIGPEEFELLRDSFLKMELSRISKRCFEDFKSEMRPLVDLQSKLIKELIKKEYSDNWSLYLSIASKRFDNNPFSTLISPVPVYSSSSGSGTSTSGGTSGSDSSGDSIYGSVDSIGGSGSKLPNPKNVEKLTLEFMNSTDPFQRLETFISYRYSFMDLNFFGKLVTDWATEKLKFCELLGSDKDICSDAIMKAFDIYTEFKKVCKDELGLVEAFGDYIFGLELAKLTERRKTDYRRIYARLSRAGHLLALRMSHADIVRAIGEASKAHEDRRNHLEDCRDAIFTAVSNDMRQTEDNWLKLKPVTGLWDIMQTTSVSSREIEILFHSLIT